MMMMMRILERPHTLASHLLFLFLVLRFSSGGTKNASLLSLRRIHIHTARGQVLYTNARKKKINGDKNGQGTRSSL